MGFRMLKIKDFSVVRFILDTKSCNTPSKQLKIIIKQKQTNGCIHAREITRSRRMDQRTEENIHTLGQWPPEKKKHGN
jgi:hypothetical protein